MVNVRYPRPSEQAGLGNSLRRHVRDILGRLLATDTMNSEDLVARPRATLMIRTIALSIHLLIRGEEGCNVMY